MTDTTNTQAAKGFTADVDYAYSVVPYEKRKTGWEIYVVWTGWIFYLGGPITGALIATGMNLWVGLLAILIGNVLLGLVASGTGVIGRRMGVSVTRVSRVAFGHAGSILVSVIVAIVMAGWCGVSIGLLAATINSLAPALPIWPMCIIFGGLAFWTAISGMKTLVFIGRWAVPVMIVVLLIAIFGSVAQNGIGSWVLPGVSMGFLTAVGVTFAHWILGASVAPDVTRWAKSDKGTIGSAMLGYGIMNTFFMGLGAMAVVSFGDASFLTAMCFVWDNPAWFALALFVIFLVVWTSADKQAYSSGLALANITGLPQKVCVAIGAGIGVILAVTGIYGKLFGFLNLIGIFVCPLAAILICDYFIINKKKYPMFQKIKSKVNPFALIAFVVGALFDKLLTPYFGIVAFNAFIVTFVVYLILMKATGYRTFDEKDGMFETTGPNVPGGTIQAE